MSLAPDYVEPVEGWRVWSVVEGRGGVLELHSLFFDLVWKPGTPVGAACLHRRLWRLRRRDGHTAPEESCQCGIHAAAEPATVRHYLQQVHPAERGLWRVFGRVALWGDVVECETGWRAQTAYPTRLWVPLDTPLAQRRPPADADRVYFDLLLYGVPVEFGSLDAGGVHVLESAA